jgi:NAD(P)-dependent dehydrogenase (short-subunit alcohol dehydrogenase family)
MSGWVLRGAVVLVTGASGGIGAAVARMLAREGARVVLTGRRTDELDRLCGELRAGGAEATAIPGDLVEPGLPARLVREAAAWGGALHGVVSCAGGGPFSLFARIDEPAFAAAIRVNLLAPIELVRAALPLLTQQSRSWVVFVNTIAAREPAPPRGSAYLSAKAGLVHFAESLFAEVRNDGVTVSSILPDLTDTPMIADALGYDRSSLIRPASVAESVLFVMTRAQDACVTELHLRPQPSLRRTSR